MPSPAPREHVDSAPMPSTTPRRPPVWALVSAAWVVPALFAVFTSYAQGRLAGRPPRPRSLIFEGGDWLVYAALTPIVFWLARRYPLATGTLTRRIPLHLGAAIVLCVAWAGGGVLLSWSLFGQAPYGGSMLGWLFTSLPFGIPVYFAVLGVEHATFYFIESRERERHAAQLAAQLAEARLGALRMQLQPHFLFNTLNAITVVVRDGDTRVATKMLEQLGDMLRRVTRADRPWQVTLAEELEFLRQYLDIEQVRFPDRLRPAFVVDDALLAAAVPEFVLQPLVENAIRHGVARRTATSRLVIAARREGDNLELSVTDEGPEPDGTPAAPGEGVGLSNTRERLATMYGPRGRLDLTRTPSGGTRATIHVPFHRLDASGG
jgi:two-component system LytT family sensor kinase